jgi:hypothetical protein
MKQVEFCVWNAGTLEPMRVPFAFRYRLTAKYIPLHYIFYVYNDLDF